MDQQVVDILYKVINNIPLSRTEKYKLHIWIAKSSHNRSLYKHIKNQKAFQHSLKEMLSYDYTIMWRKILLYKKDEKYHKRSFLHLSLKYAALLVFILMLLTDRHFVLYGDKFSNLPVAQVIKISKASNYRLVGQTTANQKKANKITYDKALHEIATYTSPNKHTTPTEYYVSSEHTILKKTSDTYIKLDIPGFNSFSDSFADPLVIVDRVPYMGDLNAIDIRDVKSITVMKDPSAVLAWGQKARSGAIVITTKNGPPSEYFNYRIPRHK